MSNGWCTAHHPALSGGVVTGVVPLAGFKPAPAEVEAQCSVQLSYRGVLDFLDCTIGGCTGGEIVQQNLFFNGAINPPQDGAQGFGKLAVVIAHCAQRAFVQAAQEGGGGGFFGVPLAVEIPHRTLAAVDFKQFSVFDKQAKTVRQFSAATGVVHQQ